jgi:hypothetical protein
MLASDEGEWPTSGFGSKYIVICRYNSFHIYKVLTIYETTKILTSAIISLAILVLQRANFDTSSSFSF